MVIGRNIQLLFNPSVPDAQNGRISAFDKKLHATERSKNVVDSVKTSGSVFPALVNQRVNINFEPKLNEL